MRHTPTTGIRPRGAALAALAVVLSGCGSTPDYPPNLTFPASTDRLVIRVPTREPADREPAGPLAEYLAGLDALGGKTFDPATVDTEQRKILDAFLIGTFGTPAAPKIEQDGNPAPLGLTAESLAEGSRLFRRHCVHCHGLAGDGQGPSGVMIHPRPRDFRRGAFKFVTTGDGGKPRRADLARTLRDGLRGSAMPAFGLLPEQERDRLAGFVVYLSLRGQVEFQTLAALGAETEGETGTDGDVTGFARERLRSIVRHWEKAEAAPGGPPAPTPTDDAGKQSPDHLESIRRGFELFTAPGGAGCLTCHADYGRKPGYRFDIWGTVVRPADLTANSYKGGNRPEELYHRIHGGIQPAGMPAHTTLADRQVWDLVHFVRALPFPRELPPDVRAKVYPE